MTFTSATIGSLNSYGGIVSGRPWVWTGISWAHDGAWVYRVAPAQVAYGNNGARWAVAADHAIFRMRTTEEWTPVPGELKQISVGNASNVWGVNAGGNIYKWTGTGFIQMPESFASVSVAADARCGRSSRTTRSGAGMAPGGRRPQARSVGFRPEARRTCGA